VLIELCAGSDSWLRQPRAAATGCYVQRITVDNILTSVEGVQKVLDLLQAHSYIDQYSLYWWISMAARKSEEE